MRALIIAASALALSGCAIGNTVYEAPSAPASPEAALDPVDVAGIDETLEAVYAVISGPVGQERDFDLMRTLFTEGAQLSSITPNGINGGSLDDYIAQSEPFLEGNGFTERQLDRRIEIYVDLAHVWSSYEGTWTNSDGSPGSVRGINSFQLARQDDGRWLVQSIFWQAEDETRPLPGDMDGED